MFWSQIHPQRFDLELRVTIALGAVIIRLRAALLLVSTITRRL